MKTIDYKAYFHAAYQGAADFNANILEPLFGSNLMPNDSNEYVREEDQSFIQNIHRCGEYVLNGDPIEFFDVTLTENCQISRNRLNIKKTVVRLMEAYSGAFIVFHYSSTSEKTTWRFSWVEKLSSNSKISAPKRYTYLCGSKYSCRTIGDRFDKLLTAKNDNTLTVNSITTAFDVEALSKDFFKEYKVFYEDIVQYICGKRYIPTNGNQGYKLESIEDSALVEARGVYRQFQESFPGNDANGNSLAEKAVRDYVKKLLGRLVFIQFLQKKGWLGISANQKLWVGGDTDFLYNLFSNSSSDNKDNFVENVLEDILFDSFNKPNSVRNEMKYPYLNGGLFERDKADELKVKLPRALFVSEKDNERKYLGKPAEGNEYDYTQAEGLFQFFDRYNFTIDENDPDDAIVGVDPEMLGKIFESLLEDNKDKGAYYTPKEIVQYMCREALIAYLTNCAIHHNGGKFSREITEKYVRELVQASDDSIVQRMSDQQKAYFGEALHSIRICDPAIGSGAFPMGLLNELVRLREDLGAWAIDKSNDRAALKKEIIQNNIYGVDIEQGAIDIARLRFWLSIMVDLDQPEPLPNFDYKFMQGNSLITTFGGEYINLDTKEQKHTNVNQMIKKKEELYNAKKEYYNASGEEKLKLAIKIKDLILQLISLQLDYEVRSETAHVDTQTNIFADTIEKRNTRPMKEIIQDLSPEKQGIIEMGKQLRYVLADVSRPLEDRAHTDIRFFDWKMMFTEVFDNDSPGFDIVIGNPPYIKEYTNKAAFDGFREHSPYYMGKMDLWYGFACHGIDLLRQNGTLCFIAQNNWTTSAGAKKMRKKIINDSRILQMLDFNTYMVFENADIQTMIMIFERNCKIDDYQVDYRAITQGNEKEDMIALLAKRLRNTKFLTPTINRKTLENKFITFSDKEYVFSSISKGKTYLQSDEIAQGIVFPQDFLNKKGAEALGNQYPVGIGIFGLTTKEKNALELNDAEQTLIKPYFTTDQIHIYYTDPNNTKWLIYTDSSFKNEEKMSEYPHLKVHLDKFLPIITSSFKPYGLHRCRKEKFFQGEKILSLRKCVGRPCFSYSDFDCYVTQTFFSIKTKRWNMKFLTGILNSKLVAFWLRNKAKMQGANYQVDKEPLQKIPLPLVDIAQQKSIIDLVDSILAQKKADPTSGTSVKERKIDILVYKLYKLTYDEVKVIDEELTNPENPNYLSEEDYNKM